MITAIIVILCVLAATALTILMAGVRVKAYFDLERGTFIADAFILGNVHAVKYKAFECNGKIYYQINSKELCQLKAEDKKADFKKNERETNEREEFLKSSAEKLRSLAEVFGTLDKIKLKSLRMCLTIGTGNSMSTSIVVAALVSAMSALQAATGEKGRIKNKEIAVYPNFRYENTVLTLEVDTGVYLAGMLVQLLKLRLKAAKSKAQAA